MSIILLPVSAYTEGGITVQQTAECVGFTYTQNTPFGGCGLAIEVLLRPCCRNEAGELVPLTGGMYRARTEHLVADNRTLVDAADGTQLATRTPDMSAGQWQSIVESFEQATMLQGDYFELLRDNVALKIGDLIRYHMLAADQLGRYR
jgi:hypothetical protein